MEIRLRLEHRSNAHPLRSFQHVYYTMRWGMTPPLFDCAEQERTYEYLITRILTSLVLVVGDLPEELLQSVFPTLDTDLKTKIIGECYRRSRDTSYSLVNRTSCLRKVLQLLALIMEYEEKEAEKVFDAFKDRWGLIFLFKELNLPETSLEDKDSKEIFAFLKKNQFKRINISKDPFKNLTPYNISIYVFENAKLRHLLFNLGEKKLIF